MISYVKTESNLGWMRRYGYRKANLYRKSLQKKRQTDIYTIQPTLFSQSSYTTLKGV